MKNFIYHIVFVLPLCSLLVFSNHGFYKHALLIEKEYPDSTNRKKYTSGDYEEVIKKIAADIKLLKNQYPQISNFKNTAQINIRTLSRVCS
ncbi:MAG: hypothetical protein HY958_02705 [Bacteroidia bacterium]|nr:hypothetical protein [Bacteroidia bacterium]